MPMLAAVKQIFGTNDDGTEKIPADCADFAMQDIEVRILLADQFETKDRTVRAGVAPHGPVVSIPQGWRKRNSDMRQGLGKKSGRQPAPCLSARRGMTDTGPESQNIPAGNIVASDHMGPA